LEFGSPLEHVVVGKFVVEHSYSIISVQFAPVAFGFPEVRFGVV